MNVQDFQNGYNFFFLLFKILAYLWGITVGVGHLMYLQKAHIVHIKLTQAEGTTM